MLPRFCVRFVLTLGDECHACDANQIAGGAAVLLRASASSGAGAQGDGANRLLASQPEGCAARSELAGWLWNERDAAASRQALRQCLFRLRNLLDDRAHLLNADRETVRLNLDNVEIDIRDFEKLVRDQRGFDPVAAAQLCTGSFCAGLDVAEEPVEQWLRQRRSELDRLAAGAFAGAAERAVADADADAAIEFARRRVGLDPFDETAQAILIGICMHFGRYGEARAVYRVCRKEFREELGVAPGTSVEAALNVRPAEGPVPSFPAAQRERGRHEEAENHARDGNRQSGFVTLAGSVAASLLAAILLVAELDRGSTSKDAPVKVARMWVSGEGGARLSLWHRSRRRWMIMLTEWLSRLRQQRPSDVPFLARRICEVLSDRLLSGARPPFVECWYSR